MCLPAPYRLQVNSVSTQEIVACSGHELIAGATGTGKTVSVRILAECSWRM
ncbi:MAG: helicase HerA-like domain-containing protein [Gammaproteobacteria bacterium]